MYKKKQTCLSLDNAFTSIKDGYAHFSMYIFRFQLIDLDLWNAFCEVSP